MSLIDILHQRASIPARYLKEPAPDKEAIEKICQAGLSAPDHAALRPWRYIVIEGAARNRLGEIFLQVAKTQTPDIPAEKLALIADKPLRSPLIITVVAKITPDHPKTPVVEQILSAGAAAQQMQLAAHALGFGSIWLTGPNARSELVKSSLGIDQQDQIAGFLYMGTPSIDAPRPARARGEDHLEYWTG